MWLTKVPAVQSRGLFRLNRSDSNLGVCLGGICRFRSTRKHQQQLIQTEDNQEIS